MDDAARARSAAREAIDDITPDPLRDLIDTRLRNGPVTPGTLTRLSARATDSEYDRGELVRRSAGVQLIYEGLDLTRTLARAPPWQANEGATRADVDILAADVLVSQGFSLLAHTEAAPTAVETVRSFGRDETNRGPGDGTVDCSLEADVFELAIVAGVAAADVDPPSGVREFAEDLAQSSEFGTESAELSSEHTIRALAELVTDQDHSPAPPGRLWAGSSATDP